MKKIIISEGCLAFYTTVDGKMLYGEDFQKDVMSEQERGELIDYLLVKVKENVKQGSIAINSLIELFQYDNYESGDEPCDQCGDTVSKTYYEI